MSEQIVKVQGLTCGHCAHAVTEEISALDGVTTVSVDLVPNGVSTVTVAAESELTTEALTAALSEAGDYTLA